MKSLSGSTVKLKIEVVKFLPSAIRKRLPEAIAVFPLSPVKSRAINKKYRKKDKPTNVLSFRYSDEYGEILVCPAVIRREARERGNTFDYQMTWMIVHGMLHLSGLHHETSAAREKKFVRVERSVLDKIFNGAKKYYHRS